MEWNIYSADGKTIRGTATKLEYNGKWMGECFVTVSVTSPSPVDFQIGDYLDYRDERFEINYNPELLKSAAKRTIGNAFAYENIKLNSPADELTRCDFLDIVPADNNLHYTSLPTVSFYAATVKDLADRIQANLDRIYTGERKWTVEVHPEYANNSDVSISETNIKVWDALALAESKFGAHFILRGRKIVIGTAGLPAGHLFKMGKGNGLKTIRESADTDQKIITRLRVYGSTRNLPHRYYNSLSGADGKSLVPDNMAVKNLMLPGFPEETLDPYLDSTNITILGIREDSVYFDGSDEDHPEVYPSIEEMTADQLISAGITTTAEGRLDEIVQAQQITDNGVGVIDGSEIVPESDTFTVTLKDIGFDINELWTDETPQISFKSGMLGSRDFEIVTDEGSKPKQNADGTWTFTLKRVYDDSLQLFFPYKSYNAKAGDRFVLLHIDMPDAYIKAASQRLKEKGVKFLSKNDYARSSYNPEIDEVMMANQHRMAMISNGVIPSLHDTIKEGDLMVFEDEDLGIGGLSGGASIFIDQLVIKEGYSPIPTYEVTLRNEKSVGTLEKMQNQIDSIKGSQGNGGGYTSAQIKQLIALYGLDLFVSKTRNDRTPYGLSVGGTLTAEDLLQSRQFIAGLMGWRIDQKGNMEVESGVFRSFAQFAELIVNRLTAVEGDQIMTEGDTIETVTDNGDGSYTLKLHEKWDGYFTAQIEHNVIKGIYNNITQGLTPGEGQQTVNNAMYYTSWMNVISVDPANNEITVILYPDEETPAGKNFQPEPMMKIARWGNSGDSEDPRYLQRQQCLYLSSTEGRVVKLFRVTKPIIDAGNIAASFGTFPEFLSEMDSRIKPGDDGIYVKTIAAQTYITMDYQGRPVPTTIDRGAWMLGERYYDGTEQNDSGQYERSLVWYNGHGWLCNSGGVATADNIPAWNTTYWTHAVGDRMLHIEFNEVDSIVDLDNPECPLSVKSTYIGDDVTRSPSIYYDWTRKSHRNGAEDTASDALWNENHRNFGPSALLTAADMNFQFGAPPEKLVFTVTATLHDPDNPNLQPEEAQLFMI